MEEKEGLESGEDGIAAGNAASKALQDPLGGKAMDIRMDKTKRSRAESQVVQQPGGHGCKIRLLRSLIRSAM